MFLRNQITSRYHSGPIETTRPSSEWGQPNVDLGGGVFKVVTQSEDGSWHESDFNQREHATNLSRFLVDSTHLKLIPKPKHWKGRDSPYFGELPLSWYHLCGDADFVRCPRTQALARADSPRDTITHPLIVQYKRGDILEILEAIQGSRWWMGVIGRMTRRGRYIPCLGI